MASWNPEIMHQSKMKIDASLQKMEELNQSLLKKASVFEASVQDEVVSNTKNMLLEMNLLIRDLKEKVEVQVEKMAKAAQGISALENRAQDSIKSFK